MDAQMTVRLSGDLAEKVADAARKLRLKRSDIIRLALDRYFSDPLVQEEPAPYERVKHLIGAFESGIADLGTSHREHLVNRIKKRV